MSLDVLLFIALGIGAWAVMTWIRLGRSVVCVSRQIRADPAAIMDMHLNRNGDPSWRPNTIAKSVVHELDDQGRPVIFSLLEDIEPGESPESKPHLREIVTAQDECSVTTQLVALGDAELPPRLRITETLEIEPAAAGNCEVSLTVDQPRFGLLADSTARARFEKYLYHLSAAVDPHAAETQPLNVRFVALWSVPLMIVGAAAIFGRFVALMVVVLVVAIMLHELGHGAAMRLFGHRCIRLAVIPFGGGLASSFDPVKSRFEDAMIALAGPGVSALFLVGLLPTHDYMFVPSAQNLNAMSTADMVTVMAMLAGVLLSIVMILVNLVNLIPLPGLDGGQIVSNLARTRTEALFYFLAFGGMTAALTLYCGISVKFLLLELVVLLVIGRWLLSSTPTLPPMTARQRAIIISAFVATVGIYAFVLQSLFDRAETNLGLHLTSIGQEERQDWSAGHMADAIGQPKIARVTAEPFAFAVLRGAAAY